jgi:hypothetical protein
VLDRSKGPVDALCQFSGERFTRSVEGRVVDLPESRLLSKGRRDAPAGGTTRLFFQDLHAIVFPCEIEQSMGEVREHRVLIDQQAGEHRVAFAFDRECLPPNFPRISYDPASNTEVGGVVHHDTCGQQIEFDASSRVT